MWSALAAGTPKRRALYKVVLPAALSSVLTGCRVGLVHSALVVSLAEMIASADGRPNYAAQSLQTVDMFVPHIAIATLTLALNVALQAASAELLAGYPLAD